MFEANAAWKVRGCTLDNLKDLHAQKMLADLHARAEHEMGLLKSTLADAEYAFGEMPDGF